MTPDPPADGTFEKRDDRYVLRFERRLRHPIERVWAALTEPGELVGWLAEAEIELVEGGRVHLRWLNHLDHLADALDGHPVDWAALSPDYRARGTGASWADHQARYVAQIA
jgi:hypothetical protein